jgi:hypothetical protein
MIIHKTKAELEQEVCNLRCDLAATDYKVIKCYEAQLIREPIPYDKGKIHADRQAIRDRINELQEIIGGMPDDPEEVTYDSNDIILKRKE